MVAEQDNPPRRGAAFFDVDRTLLRGSSLLHVARPMRREGLLSTRAMLHSLVVQARFSLAGFNEVQIHDAVRGAGDIVAGVDVERLIRFARHVMPLYVAPLVFDEALRRISWHRGRGDLVFLVSSSPVAFIAVLGEVLGVDGVTATEAEVRDGRYTGRILRLCHGEGKAEAVREAAEANHIDLAVSYAYGDSFASDLRMLEAVGHPVCVNGDRLLTAHARQLGWPVERFEHIGGGAAATSLRRLPRRVVTMSRPAVRRAGLHVRNTARALREL
jgi:HAD superfamily hydrolase (TIGR01490 family)